MSVPGGGGRGRGKEEAPTLSCHAVAYLDLSPLLYPGATQIRGAYPLHPFSEPEVAEKVHVRTCNGIYVLGDALDTPGTCPIHCWDMSYTLLGHVLDAPGTCPVHSWDMSCTLLGHVLYTPGTCPRRSWDMSYTLLGHVLDAPGTCPRRSWDMSCTLLGHVLYTPGTCPVHSWDMSWTFLGHFLDINNRFFSTLVDQASVHCDPAITD